MDKGRRGEAVVITGASTGIGRTCALHLDSLGFTVFAGVRKEADGAALKEERTTIEPVLVDVTNEDQVRAVVAKVEAAGLPLAGVVNNASIGPGGPLELIPLEDIRKIVEVNLLGSIFVTQAFLPQLRASRGRVVFVGSTAGVAAPPLLAPYAASKHAIEAVADALRLELIPWKIKVSLVQPGAIKTPIWDKGHEAVEALRQSDPQIDGLYRDAVDLLNDTASRAKRFGISPLRVAKAVSHAVTARWPKPRYAVGLDAKAITTMRRLLPDRVWDFALVTALGVPKSPPKVLGDDITAALPATEGAASVATATATNASASASRPEATP